MLFLVTGKEGFLFLQTILKIPLKQGIYLTPSRKENILLVISAFFAIPLSESRLQAESKSGTLREYSWVGFQ